METEYHSYHSGSSSLPIARARTAEADAAAGGGLGSSSGSSSGRRVAEAGGAGLPAVSLDTALLGPY